MARRRRRDPAKERHWRRMVRRWEKSGLSVREFCDYEGLSEPSLYAWRRELADRDAEAGREKQAPGEVTASDQFLPVRVVADDPVGGGPNLHIEVHLPSGVRLRVPPGISRQTLADVLAALEARPC